MRPFVEPQVTPGTIKVAFEHLSTATIGALEGKEDGATDLDGSLIGAGDVKAEVATDPEV